MNYLKSSKTRKQGKLIAVLLVLALSLFSFQIDIYPPVAGGAGADSVSKASAGATRWGLEEVHAKDAWEITQGSDEVVVAVIDSGIDRSIPALKNRMWKNSDEIPGDGIDNDGNGYVDDVHGWDFRERDQLEEPGGSRHYHGTFVGGLVSSTYDNKTGSGGVAPNVSIMDLRFLDNAGRFYTSDWDKLADAIDYATENGADIINISIYASVKPSGVVHDALKRAESNGVLVVGIAGNNGEKIGYFGRWEEVFTVGSINESGKVSGFSNYGPEVELVAPGSEVLSFRPGGNLSTGSGTSFAAPHVTGTAALILSKRPEISLSELKRALRESARDIGKSGFDEYAGHGVIDASKSLGEVAVTGDADGNTDATKVDSDEKNEVENHDKTPDLGTIRTTDGEIFRTSRDI